MKVLATRDDGAQLISDPGLSFGLLRSDDGSAVMPIASAMARGFWEVHSDPADVNVPEAVADRVYLLSAEDESAGS